MTEYIGKVKLDLSVYGGKDLYSDGDVEERLLALAKSGRDPEEILLTSDDWPLLYHFSPIRRNILEWYEFEKDANLLEIGAGCGALTGLFCDRVSSVTALDLSKRRSSINAYRHQNRDNLTIKVGNFQDMKFGEEKFDYITLMGVFEYSINYINSKDPFGDMLRICKDLLKPGGTLFIAIENKYGLKYFAGAGEDHVGRRFENVEGYPEAANVRTFSKNRIVKILTEAGFSAKFHYPYPDYKLPTAIYSDDKLPGRGELKRATPAYDRDRYVLFDEARAYADIIEDGYYPEFANSFLIICR